MGHGRRACFGANNAGRREGQVETLEHRFFRLALSRSERLSYLVLWRFQKLLKKAIIGAPGK